MQSMLGEVENNQAPLSILLKVLLEGRKVCDDCNEKSSNQSHLGVGVCTQTRSCRTVRESEGQGAKHIDD